LAVTGDFTHPGVRSAARPSLPAVKRVKCTLMHRFNVPSLSEGERGRGVRVNSPVCYFTHPGVRFAASLPAVKRVKCTLMHRFNVSPLSEGERGRGVSQLAGMLFYSPRARFAARPSLPAVKRVKCTLMHHFNVSPSFRRREGARGESTHPYAAHIGLAAISSTDSRQKLPSPMLLLGCRSWPGYRSRSR
jgi:hypothetical protein